MKTFALALLTCVSCTVACSADQIDDPAVGAALIRADWQEPQSLPPRFRNHCAYDRLSGRRYCSNHCGFEYQFYFCSRQSFGCCRIGFGYCDWDGLLRCHP
jgi:hypothetical protein